MDFVGPLTGGLIDLCPVFIQSICQAPRKDTLDIVLIVSTVAVAIIALFSSQKIFGAGNFAIFKKETKEGISKLSFFFGKLTAHIPTQLFLTFLFTTIWYAFIVARAGFLKFFGLFLLIEWVWSGFGLFISFCFSKTRSYFFGLSFILLCSTVSGYIPTLAQLQSNWLSAILTNISPMRWCFEPLYLTEIAIYNNDNVDISSALAIHGFDVWKGYQLYLDICIMILWGIFFRILALIMLFYIDPTIRSRFKIYTRGALKKFLRYVRQRTLGKKKSKKEKVQSKENHLNQLLLHDEDEITIDKKHTKEDNTNTTGYQTVQDGKNDVTVHDENLEVVDGGLIVLESDDEDDIFDEEEEQRDDAEDELLFIHNEQGHLIILEDDPEDDEIVLKHYQEYDNLDKEDEEEMVELKESLIIDGDSDLIIDNK